MMRATTMTTYVVGALLSAAVTGADTAKRPITPEDIVDIRLVSEPQISPDAKVVAFVVSEPADTSKPEDGRNSDIWIVATDGSRPPRKYAFGPRQELMPRWSPDGLYLAFLSNRGDNKKNQVYIMSTAGGEGEVLTSAKEGVDLFKWDRDSRGITFISKDSLTADEESRNKAKDDERTLDENTKYARLYRTEMATRITLLLTPENENISDFDYAPDGSQLVCVIASSPKSDDIYYRGKLIVMNRDGSARKCISEKTLGYVKWSPLGDQILHYTFKGKTLAGLPELVSPYDGKIKPLGDDYVGTIWDMDWIPDTRDLFVSSQEGVQGIVGSLNTVTGKLKSMRSMGRKHSWEMSGSVSADGKWVAFLDASPTSPNDVWVMTIEGTKVKRLTEMNPAVSSLQFGAVEKIRWSASDGLPIEGVLVKPTNYVAGERYPLVVEIHGGPQWTWWYGWQCSWHEWAQLLANNGFVVLLPNPRGSEGHGWRFADKNFQDWGGNDFQDIMSGVDYLVEQGIADPERMGIGGWSYGGYMTAWAVTQTNRFKAAVAGAGLSDLTSFYGTTDIPTFMRANFDGNPYGLQEMYDTHSALTFAKQIQTPTLILHGDADTRVPLSQSHELYQALRETGVECRFVVYPREPHSIGERAHQLDVLERVLEWYVTHVR